MKHTLEELRAIIYRHYPRGITQDDPRWDDAPEPRRLKEASLAAGQERPRWLAMLDRFQDRFPHCEIHGHALHLLAGSPAACYPGMLCFPQTPEEYHRIGFEVSFLAPYYVLYSYRSAPAHPESPVIRLEPDAAERAYWDEITHAIEATYHAEPMPTEVGHVIVPDVQPGNCHMGEAMIYDCFFDDCPRLQATTHQMHAMQRGPSS